MHSSELTIGRTFAVTFEHGRDFYAELTTFCEENEVRQGYIPFFLAGFSEVELVGTCGKVEDENAPVWSSVYLRNVEAAGGGTIARDHDTGALSPHIHVAVGVKTSSAVAHTSHLLRATILFLTEMIVVEVVRPDLTRVKNPDLYNVGLLSLFRNDAPGGRPYGSIGRERKQI